MATVAQDSLPRRMISNGADEGILMFIRVVDESLERLIRAELPLSEDLGDVMFEAPTSNWSAQLSRITVNLFLYDVGLSAHPARASIRRSGQDGTTERRPPQPMIRLGYLVSAWAGSPRDEHQLLGEVVSRLAAHPTLPAQYITGDLASSVYLRLGDDEGNRLRDIWSAAGGQLKASFTMEASVAADTYDWSTAAPAVTRVEALTRPHPARPGS
jgi:Pvc16 N-terminal domain